MKRLLTAIYISLPTDLIIVDNIKIITIDEDYGQLDEGYILRIILDFESSTRTDEVIDVNIDEKGKAKRERRIPLYRVDMYALGSSLCFRLLHLFHFLLRLSPM
jgi:hypothetical protein